MSPQLRAAISKLMVRSKKEWAKQTPPGIAHLLLWHTLRVLYLWLSERRREVRFHPALQAFATDAEVLTHQWRIAPSMWLRHSTQFFRRCPPRHRTAQQEAIHRYRTFFSMAY